jgi:hypothetical protein
MCRLKPGNVMYMEKLRQASLTLKKIIKEEKFKYLSSALEGRDLKKIWRNLNDFLGRNKGVTD